MNEVTVFTLEEHPYIELKNLLKVLGWCEHGGMAKQAIVDGQVRVDGEVELRKGRKIEAGQIVTYAGRSVRVT